MRHKVHLDYRPGIHVITLGEAVSHDHPVHEETVGGYPFGKLSKFTFKKNAPVGEKGTAILIHRPGKWEELEWPYIATSQKSVEVMRYVPKDLRRDEEGRGKSHGFGTELLKRAYDLAKAQGAKFVFARTKAENEAAIESYKKAGWKPIPQIPLTGSTHVFFGKRIIRRKKS